MGRKWSYIKWKMRRNRSAILGIAVVIAFSWSLSVNREAVVRELENIYEQYGVCTAGAVIEGWFPGLYSDTDRAQYYFIKKPEVLEYLEQLPKTFEQGNDPAYEQMLANTWEANILKENHI